MLRQPVFVSPGPEKPKDDVRRVHEIVCYECRQAHSEYKRLRTVVDQLAREYDESKDLDFVRRYTALKVIMSVGKKL